MFLQKYLILVLGPRQSQQNTIFKSPIQNYRYVNLENPDNRILH